MLKASTPLNETARLACLKQLSILDTPPEERFDRITRLAAHFFQMSITAVSLIDAERVWLKSRIGTAFKSIPRENSFCGHVIASGETVLVCDTLKDPRFVDNPYVTDNPGIRSYFGVPLYGPEGYPVGTLCMVDKKPRKISKKNLDAFMSLAAVASNELAAVDINRAVAERFYNEKWVRLLLDHLPDGIVMIDQYGNIESCNPAAEALFQASHASLVGTKASRLTTDAIRCFVSAVDEPGGYHLHEATGRRTDGSLFPMEVSVNPMYLSGKKKFAVMVRDISVRKHNEAQQRLVHERKLKYYASAAHELRSPLASILGFADMLAKRRLSDETIGEVASIMSTETARLVRLINEMLDLANLETGGHGHVDLQVQPLEPLIESTLQCLGGMEGIKRVVFHHASAMPMVVIDARMMQQALTNIISNAIKYSPEGGQIDITLQLVQKESREVVQLTVEDRGIGMTPAQQARVFEPFYRARQLSTAEGSGLGMTITRELINCQSGSMLIESALGQGTRVRVNVALPNKGNRFS